MFAKELAVEMRSNNYIETGIEGYARYSTVLERDKEAE